MEVTVNLIAAFSKYMDGRTGNKVRVPEGTTVRKLAGELGLPEKYVRLVTVNGKQIDLECLLSDGDIVFIFPPAIGGG
jgi:molybdopterin converting factor small subunit